MLSCGNICSCKDRRAKEVEGEKEEEGDTTAVNELLFPGVGEQLCLVSILLLIPISSVVRIRGNMLSKLQAQTTILAAF
jgi:hypothetical protein